MKTNISTLIAGFVLIVASAFCTVSCNQFEEERVSKTLTPFLIITDCAENQRAMAELTVLPEEYPYNVNRPLTVEYTIDGGLSTIIRVFGGSFMPMEQSEWKSIKDYSFRTGSTLYFNLWKTYVPTCYFLMPQLPAGNHSITISLRDENDEYGAAATVSASWTVK